MNIRKNNSRGITLIALIITIIILLILAGITIGTLGGENGLFARAKQARQNTLDAQGVENEALIGYEDTINSIVDGARDDIVEDDNDGYFNFRRGNQCGFTVTKGTIDNHSLGMIPTTYKNENIIDLYELTCLMEKELDNTITLNDKFEISTEISLENSTKTYVGGIVIKLYQEIEEGFVEVASLDIQDQWDMYIACTYIGSFNNTTITKNFSSAANTFGSITPGARWALIGDGSKIYIYRDNIKMNEIECSGEIKIDKIEIYFCGYLTTRVAPPMILKDLYIGKPEFYKSIVGE